MVPQRVDVETVVVNSENGEYVEDKSEHKRGTQKARVQHGINENGQCLFEYLQRAFLL
jgi:hypothetical protein